MARGDKKDYQAATFRLPPELLDKLDIESAGTGVPKGVIVERALQAWFEKRNDTEATENGKVRQDGSR